METPWSATLMSVDSQIDSMIIHAGATDLTNKVNLLNSSNKIVKKIRDVLTVTEIPFSSILLKKGRQKDSETRTNSSAKLRNFLQAKEYWSY